MLYYISAVSVVLITIAIGLYIRWITKLRNYWKVRGIPSELPTNIISTIRTFRTKALHEMLLEQQNKHGRIYGSFEVNKPVLTVSEPDLLRDILVKDFHIFNCRREFPDFGDNYVSKMVTILTGEDWKRVRTVITPAFTSKKMRQMSHIINECSKTVTETLKKYAESGKPADFKSIFGAFTMDAIASSAFATKIDSHNDPQNPFVQHAKKAFGEPSIMFLLAFFVLPPWLVRFLPLEIFPSSDFFKDVVFQIVKERRATGKRYDDILQLFLDAQDVAENESSKGVKNSDEQDDDVDQYGSIISDGTVPKLKYKHLYEDELVAQCMLFYIVGYETTASTLSFMAYLLALNPECQEKLIEEVDEAFKKHNELDYDVIRDMKYLDCVVSETLRMYPALSRSERTATEDYKLGKTGLLIEKGTIVGFNIHAMHHDPEFFPNPEKFDPERFMNGNTSHHPYAYLPFGAGPRNCLGMRFALMEIKLCMSNILRYYRIKKSEITKVPLELRNGQGLMTVNELPLLVQKRN